MLLAKLAWEAVVFSGIGVSLGRKRGGVFSVCVCGAGGTLCVDKVCFGTTVELDIIGMK